MTAPFINECWVCSGGCKNTNDGPATSISASALCLPEGPGAMYTWLQCPTIDYLVVKSQVIPYTQVEPSDDKAAVNSQNVVVALAWEGLEEPMLEKLQL